MKQAGLSTVAIIMAVASLSACSGASGSSRAGGDPAPVTLRIGTDDVPGRPAADAIEEFARRVQEISDGQLLIEPAWQAAGLGRDDWDQAVARLVVSGDLDMGLIPARAWDTEGVTSLRALHAPFLVTSEAHVAEVVTSEVAAEMLSGLDQAGVTGLTLVPEGLRQVFAFGEPLLTPADFEGVTVRAPRSDTTAALFEAMGATVDDLPGDLFFQGVTAGTVVAAESSFAFAGSLPLPLTTTVTGNLTLYPKVNSLVINTETFAGLDHSQQQTLREAATDTRDWGVESMAPSADSAIEYCAAGGTVVTATDEDLAAFRAAAEPVYAELERDAQTRSLIEEIRDLAAQTPAPERIGTCGPATATTPASPTSTGAFPEGVYRAEMFAAVLREAGVDAGAADDMAGIHTLTFDSGRWVHSVGGTDCAGTYLVESGRLVVVINGCGGADGVLFSAGWNLDGTRLTFEQLSSDTDPQQFVDATWGGQPWEKIG